MDTTEKDFDLEILSNGDIRFSRFFNGHINDGIQDVLSFIDSDEIGTFLSDQKYVKNVMGDENFCG